VTGVSANPWSLAGIASLVGSSAVRIREGDEASMRIAVAEKRYGLGFYVDEKSGREEYGIVLLDDAGRGLNHGGLVGGSDPEDVDQTAKGRDKRAQMPFVTLRYPWRVVFGLFQLAVLVFVIYYHAYYRGGIRDNGRLWLFLNSNEFGVRFVSAVIGVILAFCWQTLFISESAL